MKPSHIRFQSSRARRVKSNLAALRACFRNDAVIIEVSRTIAGIESISRWARAEVFGGRYTLLQVVSQEKMH